MDGLLAPGAGKPDVRKPAADDDGIPTEEAAGLILEMKTKHYATWADEPMPAPA